METKQAMTAEDALYEQALSSLRQLNQEVFLNDLDTKLKQTILMIQQEVDDLKAKLEEDQLYLSSSIQNLKQVVHSDSTRSVERVEELDEQVRSYFRDFYGHFTTEIEQMKHALASSVSSTEQLVANHMSNAENQMQDLQVQQKTTMEYVDTRFEKLEQVYNNWLRALNEMKDDFAKQSTAFHAANEAQRLHFQTGQGELSRQVDKLNATIQKLEHQQDELREATKQEFLQAVADSNASRLAWEQTNAEEMKARAESDVVMRQQLLDDVNASTEAKLIQLKEENEALAKQNEMRFKQNRWILIGLGVLGAAQIALQLI